MSVDRRQSPPDWAHVDLTALDRIKGQSDPRDLIAQDPFPVGGNAQLASSPMPLDHSQAPLHRGFGLGGVDGGLPNHLYDRMLESLFDDEQGFLDFLAHLNAPLKRRFVSQSRQFPLPRIQDGNKKNRPADNSTNSLIGLANAIGRSEDSVPLIGHYLGLTSGRNNMLELRRILATFTGFEVEINVTLGLWQNIPNSRKTRLSAQGIQKSAAALGKGTAIGHRCRTSLSIITISLQVNSAKELAQCRGDTGFVQEIRRIVGTYIKIKTHVRIHAKVKQRDLGPAVMSANQRQASRLGRYQILTPSTVPQLHALVTIENTGAAWSKRLQQAAHRQRPPQSNQHP